MAITSKEDVAEKKDIDVGSSKAKRALFQDKPADAEIQTGDPYKFNKPFGSTKFACTVSFI